MNVLSLFDGMSCGRVALDRAGIGVNNYYASEIDKYAMQISNKNYPDTIQLGSVTDWKEWDIDFSKIDLLIAGFPCQAWSVAGKQKGDSDPRGALIHDLIAIWQEIKKHNPEVKFLFENVKMKKEFLDYVNNLFGVEPILVNSNLITEANRNRYYWTNIEKVGTLKKISLPSLCNPDEVYATVGSSKNRILRKTEKLGVLTATMYKGVRASGRPIIAKKTSIGKHIDMLVKNVDYRGLTPIECERLQTLPDNYTESVSNTQRYKMIGNGWTVDVISHIFIGLK